LDVEKLEISKRMFAAWKIGAYFFVAVVSVVLGLSAFSSLTPGPIAFLEAPSPLPVGIWVAGVLATALFFSGGAILVRWYDESRIKQQDEEKAALERKLNREKAALEQELRQTKRLLTHTEHLMVTDPITGIPNFRSWQRHSAAWPLTPSARRLSCLVLIDLDKLRSLNEISYDCANRVLELFATRTYHSMRRNEHAFKIPDRNAPLETAKPVEMFRHFPGGDEFCFHLVDDVLGTIGFMNRLLVACAKLEAEIKNEILPEFMNEKQISAYRLQFCAAVVPISSGVTPDDVISSALTVLNLVKKHPSTRLMVQFVGQAARSLSERKTEIEREMDETRRSLDEIKRSGLAESPSESTRLQNLEKQLSDLKQQAEFLGQMAPRFAK
jgi:GGDEF domain-containing protein